MVLLYVMWVCVIKSKVNVAVSFTINWHKGNRHRRKIAVRMKERVYDVLIFKDI
jgi:hypothetical protein